MIKARLDSDGALTISFS